MKQRMSGMYAALMSAMDETGELDMDRQRELTGYVLGQGLRGLYVGGSSGEFGLLETAALAEQQAVVAECAAGKGHVMIAHVGMPSLAASIALAKGAKKNGYDALSALPPHSYPFNDAEIYDYYRQLSAATDLPLIVYEIPFRTGRPLPLDLLTRILDLTNVAGIKFTSDDLFKLSQLRRRRPDALYFFGSDETFLGAASLGVDGGIGTTYNLFGKLYAALFEAVQAGDLALARSLQMKSQEFVEILMVTGVMPGMKAAFRLIGVECGPTWLPMALRATDAEERLKPFLEREDIRPWLAV